MSDIVFIPEMEVGNSEMPVTIANEMPVENEIAVDNEMSVGDGNTCENEDRSIVDGESYASRAARTIPFGERPRHTVPASNENSMPQRVLSSHGAKQRLPDLCSTRWLTPTSITPRSIVYNEN